MSDERIYVAQDTLLAAGENTWVPKKGNKMGFAVMMERPNLQRHGGYDFRTARW
jgi:hypothetical protein